MSNFPHELRHWSQRSCRFYLENSDFQFIKSVFEIETLGLTPNEKMIQSFINDDKLVKAILESPGQLNISPQLYFYALLKKIFEESGIYNTPLIDYIVFLLTLHIQALTNNDENEFLYITDHLKKIDIANSSDRFYLRVQLANKILVLTGLFQEYMKYRTDRRGAPNISFYEIVGCTQYEVAMHHPLANELDLKTIFSQLSTSFVYVRQILNQFSERFICLGDPFHRNEPLA